MVSHSVLLFVVLIFLQNGNSQSLPVSALTTQQKIDLLDYHNSVRRATAKGEVDGKTLKYPMARNMNELKWDDGLANIAQWWADSAIYNYGYKHSSTTMRNDYFCDLTLSESNIIIPHGSSSDCKNHWWYPYGFIGESTSWGSTNPLTLAKYWKDYEAHLIDYPNDDIYDSDTMNVAGHFLAMIYADTRYIGCGFNDKIGTNDPPLLVCHYYPKGNIDTWPIYDSSGSCSFGYDSSYSTWPFNGGYCWNDRDSCNDGLCSGCMNADAPYGPGYVMFSGTDTNDLCGNGISDSI